MYDKAVDKIKARAVAITQPLVEGMTTSEELIAYCARVSSPNNQNNHETADKLLAYCLKHGHVSVFEQVDLTIEIEAPRDITRQIIRHRSGMPQEFSQRYADVTEDMFCIRELRMQDDKNRQNSIFTTDEELAEEWEEDQTALIDHVRALQDKWRKRGAAKEVVRVIMPEGNTMSRMYFKAPIRTWISYCKVRGEKGVTQEEHTWVAEKCKDVIKELLPTVYKMMD